MIEDQKETETPNQPDRHFAGTLIFAGIFMAIYFLFPVLLLYPLSFYYGKKAYPQQVLQVVGIVFYPVEKLYDSVPAYRRLIDMEFEMLGTR